MKIKELFIHFVIVFFLVLIVATVVTYLWNLLRHGSGVFEWETSFRLALIFGIVFPALRFLENKKNQK